MGLKMNEFVMIAAIFIVGILIIGTASFFLFNKVVVLEQTNTNLDINNAVISNRLTDSNLRVNELLQNDVAQEDLIASYGTLNEDLVVDNNILQFNYNVGQQELVDQRVLMEQTMLDNNELQDDLTFLRIFFEDEFDLNIHDDNFGEILNTEYITNEEYEDLEDFFLELRNDFGYCYWEHHCTSDENACQQAYGAVIDANILKTLFAASCENISDEDYNAYAAFE